MTPVDTDLVGALCTRRAEDAARALYRAYGGELYGFVLKRLGDPGAAEEVVQDVFLRAWRYAADYDRAHGSVRTWLYAITRNAVVDAERRRGRRPALAGSDVEVASRDEPIEQALLRWEVQLAFRRLTLEHREVIALAHLHGLRLQDIADRTGLPLGTVKSRMYYGLRSLRLALEELGVSA